MPKIIPLNVWSLPSLAALIGLTCLPLETHVAAAAPDSPELAVQSVNVVASPLVPKGQDASSTVLLVSIDSKGLTNATVGVNSLAWPAPKIQEALHFRAGHQTVTFEVPRIENAISVSVQIGADGAERKFGPFTVTPPRQWTVYLTQHTHTDIGYTRPQTEILPEHIRYIDYALDYCDLTDSYPDDARFRWTCETSWAVREYLKTRPAAQVERLKKRIADGRIEVCGMMLNMAEIAGESSLAALLRPLRAMKDDFHLPVRTAMQDDVNGAGWCLVDYFHDLGIRYLSMGINKTRSILPFDRPTPFWWESPSGKRVLAYRSDHYHLGNFWHIHEGKIDRFKPGLEDYLLSLQQRQYPFDRIGVQFSGYHTDNSPPSTIACDLVRAWNEQYAWPKLRLSTAQEFLGYVEKEHGTDLPVHRQAWPDWWTDGFGSAARETAAVRQTESALQVSQGLFTIASILGARLSPNALSRTAAIQDDVLFYAEHTFGAAESISDPLAENTQVQWGEKASYAWTAVKDSSLLREEALGQVQDFLPRAEVSTLAVLNTLSWTRSGLVRVFIDHQILPPDREFRILDGSTAVLAQAMERRAEGTYWALWVKDVPPLGYKVLRIEPSDQPRARQPEHADALTIENQYYRLSVDDQRGAITSLVDKETGQELVDNGADWALGQCVYETMPANRELKPGVFQHSTVRKVKVKPGAGGPIWKSLLVSADLDGCATNNGLRCEICLFETEKRLELHFNARKLPIPGPESLYVAFPFRAPNSTMLYEAQGGLVRPGQDQIPGSSSDWQTLQSFIAIRSSDTQVILGSEEAPLVQLGELNLGKWQPVTRVAKPHIYSWVMNNYWFTNFRTEQEGEFKWRYYLTSTKDMSRTAATRFGWASRIPLVTRVLPPSKAGQSHHPQTLSALGIQPSNVLVVEARPARDREAGVVLHLRELEGKTTTLTSEDLPTWAGLEGADEVNVLEEPIEEGIQSVTLKPYESKFVRLWFR
jgi:alpha-mannosidase